MFHLQIQCSSGWRPVASFSILDDAYDACNRAVLSEKTNCRLVETGSPLTMNYSLSTEGVVYDKVYIRESDPEMQWAIRNGYIFDDDEDEPEDPDEYGLDWRQSGF